VQECEQQNCITLSPTMAPTASPTASPTFATPPLLSLTPGLHFLSDVGNFTSVPYLEYYPAFALNAIPINPDRVFGPVVRIAGADLCNVDLSSPNAYPANMVVLTSGTEMACSSVNEPDPLQTFVISTRLAAQAAYNLGAAAMIVYGNEATAFASQERSGHLTKRNNIPTPVVLISESNGASVLGLLSTPGNSVQGQLSKTRYCDSVWAYDIPLPDTLSPACCAAADIILAADRDTEPYFDRCPQSLDGQVSECYYPYSSISRCYDECQHLLSGGNANYKSNGICEDGSDGADLSMCSLGNDCLDCGSQDMNEMDMAAWTRPTDASYERARDYACPTGCTELAKEYIERIWGEGDYTAALLTTSCSDDVACTLPGLYSIPRVEEYKYLLPTGTNSTCCAATEVLVSHFRAVIGGKTTRPEDNLFACPAGDAVLNVECDAAAAPGKCDDTCSYSKLGFCLDGGLGSVDYADNPCVLGTDCTDCGSSDRRPNVPTASTVAQALSLMCSIPNCLQFVDETVDLAEHLRGKTEIVNRFVASHGHFANAQTGFDWSRLSQLSNGGLHGYLDLASYCDSPSTTGVCIVGSLYFVSPSESSDGSGSTMTCCRAAEILFGEMDWQGVNTPGAKNACDDSGGVACDAYGRVASEDVLREAKKFVAGDTACMDTLDAVVQRERQDDDFLYFVGIDSPTFRSIVTEADVCWLQYAPDVPLFGVPQIVCKAFDVWMSWQLWTNNLDQQGAFDATRHYATCVKSVPGLVVTCGSSFAGDEVPRPDEATLARAEAVLCEGASQPYMVLLQASATAAGIPAWYVADPICSDPCRCGTAVPSAVGCGFHDPSYGRSYCFVADPLRCERTTTAFPVLDSTVFSGEKWTHCALSHDSCQQFVVEPERNSPCSAFVEENAVVYVPAGETEESMQVIENVVSNLNVNGTQNELEGWLLSASFDSAACYRAVGEFMCNSIFLRCSSPIDSGTQQREAGATCPSDDPTPSQLSVETCTSSVDSWSDVCQPIVLERGLITPAMKDQTCGMALSVFEESDYGYLPDVISTRGFNNLRNLGTPLFATNRSGAEIELAAGFSEEFATSFVSSCPQPFVLNDGVQFQGGSDRFCVAPCPSFVYSEDEYRSMWYGYTVIGVLGLFLNLFEAADLAWGFIKKKPLKNAFVYWIISLSVIHGLFVVVPVVSLFDRVPCGECGTELCFGGIDNVICQLNKISVFVLHAILFCTLWGMSLTLRDLTGPLRGGKGRAARSKGTHGLVAVAIPVLFCAIAFAIEKSDGDLDQEEVDFYMARAGFSCYMRLTVVEEVLLVQLPFIVGGSLVCGMVSWTLKILVGIVTMSVKNETTVKKFKKIKALQPIILLCVNITFTTILWAIISIVSAPEFKGFIVEVEDWYDCTIFDYAQSLLYGSQWGEIKTVDCGLFPENKPSVTVQHIRYIAEVYIPFTVAMSFGGWKKAVAVHSMLFKKAADGLPTESVLKKATELSYYRPKSSSMRKSDLRSSDMGLSMTSSDLRSPSNGEHCIDYDTYMIYVYTRSTHPLFHPLNTHPFL
jgi:hypothetical protein